VTSGQRRAGPAGAAPWVWNFCGAVLSLLLERLGLELPKRLRTVETMIPQTAQM